MIGTALAVGWAGCGLTAVGSHEDAPVPATQVDATGASLTETSVVDTALPPVPGTGSTQLPIGDLDAGADADLDAEADADAATTTPPTFEILAPAGGAFHKVTPGDVLPCSTGGSTPAAMVVKNLGPVPVTLGWVDYACVEESYGILGSNRQYTQPTYVGHRWRIRSAVDAGIRGDFVLDAPGTYTVIVH